MDEYGENEVNLSLAIFDETEHCAERLVASPPGALAIGKSPWREKSPRAAPGSSDGGIKKRVTP